MAFRLVDYEATSFANLQQVGSLVYSKDPSTRPLCVASWRDGDPEPEVLDRIGVTTDRLVSWGRFDFEIYREKEAPYPSTRWVDLSAVSRHLGMPGGLDDAAKAFGVPARKDPRGKKLIEKYCHDPTLIIPADDMAALREYAKQDVVVLQQLWKLLSPILPEWEQHWRDVYEMTARMNERGVPLDIQAVRAALFQCEAHEASLESEMQIISGGLRPSQNLALAELLKLPNLTKRTLESLDLKDPTAKRIVEIRLEFAKAATKKLKPMLQMGRATGRAHGCFVANGALTGRGASRAIQFQNMKRSKTASWVFERLRKSEPLEVPLRDVGNNIRGFIHSPGHKIVVADYSQVEARLVAWMANERSMLEGFKAGRDVYREFASAVYKVKPEDVSDEQRTYGKIVVLGAGYGAGGAKLAEQALGYDVKMTVEEGNDLKFKYRRIYPAVPHMWASLDKAVVQLIDGRINTAHVAQCELSMISRRQILCIKLPSGRKLRYFYPRVSPDGEISYVGKYGRRKIWGGHFTENIAQAMATDLKNDAMVRLDHLGLALISEVHDEIICESETEKADMDLATMLHVMHRPPSWAPVGLIEAEGKVLSRYSK